MSASSVLITDLGSLSLTSHSIGASDTVSSHGDYNSLLDESCETLPEGGLGQMPAAGFPPTTIATHGNQFIVISQTLVLIHKHMPLGMLLLNFSLHYHSM